LKLGKTVGIKSPVNFQYKAGVGHLLHYIKRVILIRYLILHTHSNNLLLSATFTQPPATPCVLKFNKQSNEKLLW